MQGAYETGLTDVNQFKYRNFIMGFKDVVIGDSEVSANNVNFVLSFVDPVNTISNMQYGAAVYDYLYGDVFHLRVRTCS